MKTLSKKILIAAIVATPFFISNTASAVLSTSSYFRAYSNAHTFLYLDDTDDTTDWYVLNDWEVTNSFSVWNTVGRPLTIEWGAATNLLYLDSLERVGINTSAPVEELDVRSTLPAIRLDDTSTGAGLVDLQMSNNTFSIEGNSSQDIVTLDTFAPANSIRVNGFGMVGIETATPLTNMHVGGDGDIFLENGTQDWHVVQFNNDAPANSLVIEGTTGDMGIGTNVPVADLHVQGEGTGVVEDVLRLQSTVPPQITMRNSTANKLWFFAMTADNDFKVSLDGTGDVEAKFFQNGDLKILGALTQGSDRNRKNDIVAVDNKKVLETVAKLPISTWAYKSDDGVKHMGPMAQDFHAAFGLGTTPLGISSIDTGGVALAAIKGLNEVVQSKDKEIETLKSELEANTAVLAELKEMVHALVAKGQVASAQ
jgi:hypothetical protein